MTDSLLTNIRSTDPALGLRAVGALHRLAEQVEATHVEIARRDGWSWEQIGDALGVSRQSAHAKHGKPGEPDKHAKPATPSKPSKPSARAAHV